MSFSWIFSLCFISVTSFAADDLRTVHKSREESLRSFKEFKSLLDDKEYKCDISAAKFEYDLTICVAQAECKKLNAKLAKSYSVICRLSQNVDCSKVRPCLDSAIAMTAKSLETKTRPSIEYITAKENKKETVTAKSKCSYLSKDGVPESIIFRLTPETKEVRSSVACTSRVECTGENPSFVSCEPDDFEVSSDDTTFWPICPSAGVCHDNSAKITKVEMSPD